MAANLNQVYYLPIEYPTLMCTAGTFKKFNNGKCFRPKGIEVKFLDYRATNEFNNSNDNKIPVNVNKIGIKFF